MIDTWYVKVLVYFATAERHGRYKRVYDDWEDAMAHIYGLQRRAERGDCDIWVEAVGHRIGAGWGLSCTQRIR